MPLSVAGRADYAVISQLACHNSVRCGFKRTKRTSLMICNDKHDRKSSKAQKLEVDGAGKGGRKRWRFSRILANFGRYPQLMRSLSRLQAFPATSFCPCPPYQYLCDRPCHSETSLAIHANPGPTFSHGAGGENPPQCLMRSGIHWLCLPRS